MFGALLAFGVMNSIGWHWYLGLATIPLFVVLFLFPVSCNVSSVSLIFSVHVQRGLVCVCLHLSVCLLLLFCHHRLQGRQRAASVLHRVFPKLCCLLTVGKFTILFCHTCVRVLSMRNAYVCVYTFTLNIQVQRRYDTEICDVLIFQLSMYGSLRVVSVLANLNQHRRWLAGKYVCHGVANFSEPRLVNELWYKVVNHHMI